MLAHLGIRVFRLCLARLGSLGSHPVPGDLQLHHMQLSAPGMQEILPASFVWDCAPSDLETTRFTHGDPHTAQPLSTQNAPAGPGAPVPLPPAPELPAHGKSRSFSASDNWQTWVCITCIGGALGAVWHLRQGAIMAGDGDPHLGFRAARQGPARLAPQASPSLLADLHQQRA